MESVPDSLAIALWITGTSWGLAIPAYLLGQSTEWILPHRYVSFFSASLFLVSDIRRCG